MLLLFGGSYPVPEAPLSLTVAEGVPEVLLPSLPEGLPLVNELLPELLPLTFSLGGSYPVPEAPLSLTVVEGETEVLLPLELKCIGP